eukprot:448459-Amphidinium_carterae.1
MRCRMCCKSAPHIPSLALLEEVPSSDHRVRVLHKDQATSMSKLVSIKGPTGMEASVSSARQLIAALCESSLAGIQRRTSSAVSPPATTGLSSSAVVYRLQSSLALQRGRMSATLRT